jgi:hypothetical protein
MLHDHPQIFGKNDLFNRLEFSNRIAQLIKNRIEKESIVFGINGAWGDGKTTVLNFIVESLQSDYPKTIVIKFNPWRFSDEGRLLETFFTTISTELSKSLNSEEKKVGMKSHERKSDLKQISDILGDYTDALGEIPIPGFSLFGKVATTAFKKYSTTELEQKKIDLSNLISKYERKIVVIIDDIDRLSKDEVYTIFRLVKLTGDFNHFVYLLAYDEEKVAAAIGQRFSDSDKEAGKSFIEKIVQIPVKLPEISFQDLNRFFSTTFEKILYDNKIVVDQPTKARFEKIFSDTLIFSLDSPRKVVRYCNAIQFSLPLMSGEVNFADLIFFEGLKVFFPKQFEFIRDNSDYFLNNHSKSDRTLRENFNNEYNIATDQLSKQDKTLLKRLLLELFPTLEGIWNNTFFSEETFNQWTRQKRIVSREYFNRYLTYSLGKTDVSDRAFELFVDRLKSSEPNDVAQEFVTFIKQYDIGNVIQKLRLIEEIFSAVESEKIARGLCQVGNHLPRYEGFMSFVTSPSSQAAILIAKLITNIKEPPVRLKAMTYVCSRGLPLEFSFEINKWLRTINENNNLLTDEELQSVGEKIKDRMVEESFPEPFFIKFPDQATYAMSIWSRQNKAQLTSHLKMLIEQNPNILMPLLKSLAGKGYLLGSNSSQMSDINQGTINFIENTIGIDWLYDAVKTNFKSFDISDVLLDSRFDATQSEQNIIKQFIYWYQNRTTPNLKHN